MSFTVMAATGALPRKGAADAWIRQTRKALIVTGADVAVTEAFEVAAKLVRLTEIVPSAGDVEAAEMGSGSGVI
jgi:hypothetical protein